MSRQLINQYYNKLHKLIQYGGSRNETAVRGAFQNLIDEYAQRKNLMLVTEIPVKGTKGRPVTPDGVLRNSLTLTFGLWESKDEKDTLEAEIKAKISKGYPLTNILFEDTQTAVLYQNGELAGRVSMKDEAELDKILTRFVSFDPPEVKEFYQALAKFKEDIPEIVQNLRELMDKQERENVAYQNARDHFFELCQAEINPDIAIEDIREMMIQHILTEDIFNTIFDNVGFHRANNIAKQLEAVIETFMTYGLKQNYLSGIQHYYQTLREHAAGMVDHNDKQKVLKSVYEEFYKVYNPKGADRLGVVYTPQEIVRFMVEGADHLLEKHFGKNLHDKNVEILDPATGTGTFITDIIDYISPPYLKYKYQNEIHANEVAILPYYIANLNIEYTYQQKMREYEEFKNMCFVDTLDNTDGLAYEHQSMKLAYELSFENAKRIREQNKKDISVIIGNPPYNANQKNFNEYNSNRKYKEIDRRFKETFVAFSKAKKHKYDMYLRFYRWAMDRLDRRKGVIAFVTNRGFLKDKSTDGFRKAIEEQFQYAYIIDTKSDVIENPKISGTVHNVFGIKEGVAIMFVVRNGESPQSCKIKYFHLEDEQRRTEKLQWLRENTLKSIEFINIEPDANHNWLDLSENDWEFNELFNLVDEDVKKKKRASGATFTLFSNGIVTARDPWNFDFDFKNLRDKAKFFCKSYEIKKLEYLKLHDRRTFDDKTVKYSSEILEHFEKNSSLKFKEFNIRHALYRPFVGQWTYFDRIITHRIYQQNNIFPIGKNLPNKVICFSGLAASKPFQVLATDKIFSYDTLEKTQCLPLYTYDLEGHSSHNITDWALTEFRENYKDKKIKKEDIFHYVYGVLHDPEYRAKYELNLKREFPRVPFYKDFWQWANWGAELMKLHIGYESVKPYNLKEKTVEIDDIPRTKLRSDKEAGTIALDSNTTLEGVPVSAWEYKLGNRSALEWVLDQYKEKKPSDPTIAEKFNTYRFNDYKEHVIDLLKRVCTVSIETMKIVEAMKLTGKHFR